MKRALLGLVLLLGCESSAEPVFREVAALEADGWLVSTTATPSGDSWLAVGGTPTRGAIHRKRESWMLEPTPEVPLLNWGQLFADGTGFVVGNGGTVLHHDGVQWTTHSSPTTQDLWGVWGATPDDVWAVGGAGQQEGQATLLHYDGASWTTVALPPLARPNVWALYNVWGFHARDVYAVGQRGVVLHFDGASWSELGVGTSDDLIALWGVPPSRLAIVGGRGSGVIATFDGTQWKTAQLAPLPGLNGVWMGDADTIHVAGIQGTLATVDFDTLAVEPSYQPLKLTFHALHGAGNRLLAVGGNLDTTRPPYLGLARERVGVVP
jgi:hypothetical protein